MKIEIKSAVKSLLFEGDFNCLAEAIREAIDKGANLRGANLQYASLSGANLSRANLSGANLSGAKILHTTISDSQRPIFILGPLGSRNSYLTAYSTKDGVYVSTGCFLKTLPEFSVAVAKTHGTNQYVEEYIFAIKLIKKTLRNLQINI